MAKKILILSEPFAPPSFLPRITNLCKNLDSNKWAPEIFTEKIDKWKNTCNFMDIAHITHT